MCDIILCTIPFTDFQLPCYDGPDTTSLYIITTSFTKNMVYFLYFMNEFSYTSYFSLEIMNYL